MKTWTNQAEKRLAEYLEERVRREGFDGEEADELKSDLRRHIHEEAEKESGEGIGSLQLEGILGRLDAGYQSRPEVEKLESYQAWSGTPKKLRPFWAWTWAVVLPLGVAVFELLTAFCGSVFFDPVATGWHVALVLLVPLVNAWILKGAPGGSERIKGFAAGFVLVIALLYLLLFLPLLPASVIALIFVGMGLLSLTPVMAGLWTWRIGRRLRRESTDAPAYRRGWRTGFAAALLALVVLEGPALWTRANLSAATEEGDSQAPAIGRLRSFHSQRALLRACYEGNTGTTMATDISGWMSRGWEIPGMMFDERGSFSQADSAKVRDVFFRVTGKPFNSVKPPRMVREGGLGRGRSNAFREMEFDEHLGGDEVAVRLKHLDLAESRFDGHLDARSGLGYGEWTMVFHNGAANAQEARCQVLLPRGGRVSRLTLWVNGEPREAAFNSVSKVKAAYKEIAVVQRRDPVLVTMAGPDTILMQCFPVPAGGEMKIRFGITAPCDGELWELPRILERNFGTKDGLEHAVWLQGEAPFDLLERDAAPRKAAVDGPGHSMMLSLPPESAMGGLLAVKCGGAPTGASPALWCEDKFAPAFERFLIREPKPVRQPAAGKILVVVDGSSAMGAAKPWIVEALKGRPVELMLADDTARPVTLAELESQRFSGGRDNEPALREAVRRAKSGEADAVVWLHGPQAVGLSQTEALLQMIERGTRVPAIHSVMAVAGPNRLAESLHRSGVLRRGPALLDPRADLAAFVEKLGMEHDAITWHWRRSPTAPEDLGTPVWDHLARQWAMEAVDSPLSTVPEIDRPALAARYQLVTRVSGAVVLETMEQFERHGLKPVDAAAAPSIPGVPEPSSALLVLIGGAGALMRRRRNRPGHE
jgi:hypothetical protein